MKDFIAELEWRGMLHDATPGIREHLSKPRTGYIGFDPTAPSMTIGNFVQIQLLTLFQRCGHTPVVLMGGATGRVGDPSGKDKERELKSYDELDNNLRHQVAQMKRFLDFEEGENRAVLVNNLDFYKDMNVLTFLRDVGKTLTVNYMSSKESVKKRVETGMSFTEFSYQLLQGYDYQCLFQQRDCTLQMGGSDQWGNITSGTEFIRRNLGGKAYAVTTPLLTKSDGSKFGKSEKGNIWLDAEMTSPYAFYQFWLRADDADTSIFLRYFTLKNKEEVEAMEAEFADQPQQLKNMLAEELTIRVHGRDAFESARLVSKLLFQKMNAETLRTLSADALATVSSEVPSFTIPRAQLAEGIAVADLMTDATTMSSSKGEARRAIKNNSVSINKQKVKSHDTPVTIADLLHDRFIMIENGKKNKYMVEVV